MMAEVLRAESDTDHHYRITRTDRGVLVSCVAKGEMGLLLGRAEWLYQTVEAAQKGLDQVTLMNAWWSAAKRGYHVGDLPVRCSKAIAEHLDAVERLNDRPEGNLGALMLLGRLKGLCGVDDAAPA